MTELADLGNVVCKISGATTEADIENWTIDDVRPYVEHALNAFGEDKVLFGSDWPVVTQAASYPRWVETVQEITKDFTNEQKNKLWKDNAVRFYRLEDEV
jgi:L-fuconolactonase